MNFNYHIGETSIKCPHCDKPCEDSEYEVASNMDNRIEFECEHCGKIFWAQAVMAYDTYSDCSLNKIEHEWDEPPEKHPTLFHCKNCYQYEVRKP